MQGWICLHRQLLEWEWYDDINVRCLFIHCLLRANHKDGKWKGQTIPRGSFITGRNSLADEVGLTVQQIRTALDKLKSTNDLTIKATNKNSLVTVVNYGVYQDKGELVTSETTNKPLNEQPTNNQQITTNNNDNNEKQSKQKRKVVRFTPPTIDEVKEYCLERQNHIDPNKFINYYESNGWQVGRNKMKDWKAAVRNWESKSNNTRPVQQDLSQQHFVSGKF